MDLKNVIKNLTDTNQRTLPNFTIRYGAEIPTASQRVNATHNILVVTHPPYGKRCPNNDCKLMKSSVSSQNDASDGQQCLSLRDENENMHSKVVRTVTSDESNRIPNINKTEDLIISVTEYKIKDLTNNLQSSNDSGHSQSSVIVPIKSKCPRCLKTKMKFKAEYDQLLKDKRLDTRRSKHDACCGEELNLSNSFTSQNKYLLSPSDMTDKSKGISPHPDGQISATQLSERQISSTQLSERQTSTTTLRSYKESCASKSDNRRIAQHLPVTPKCNTPLKPMEMCQKERNEFHGRRNLSNLRATNCTKYRNSNCTYKNSQPMCSNHSHKNQKKFFGNSNIAQCRGVTNNNLPDTVFHKKISPELSCKTYGNYSQNNTIPNYSGQFVHPASYKNDEGSFPFQQEPISWFPPSPQVDFSNFGPPTLYNSWKPEQLLQNRAHPETCEVYSSPNALPGPFFTFPGDERIYAPVSVDWYESEKHRKPKSRSSKCSKSRSRRSRKTDTSSSESSSESSHTSRSRREKKDKSRSRSSTKRSKDRNISNKHSRSRGKNSRKYQTKDRPNLLDMYGENRSPLHSNDRTCNEIYTQGPFVKMTQPISSTAIQRPEINGRQEMLQGGAYRGFQMYLHNPWPYQYYYWPQPNILPEYSTFYDNQIPPDEMYLPQYSNRYIQ